MKDTISIEEHKEAILLNKLAAFVDGEGTIGITRQSRKPSYNYRYHERLQIVNTDIRLINWLVDNFGGKLPQPIDNGENHKDKYSWELGGYSSYKLIKRIYPYLILKQEQADCCIELYEKVSTRLDNNKPLTGYKKELAERLYQKCKELNKRGIISNNNEEIEVSVKIRKDVLDEWLGGEK